MTEAEWLATEDVKPLIAYLVDSLPEARRYDWGARERRKWLFILACADPIWPLLPVEQQLALKLFDPDAQEVLDDDSRHARWSTALEVEWDHAGLLFALNFDQVDSFCQVAVEIAAARHAVDRENWSRREQREQTKIFRDIFGNPFRLVAFDSAWRTPTVTSLAQAIYDERRFADLPILADALEDAGCTSADVLEHCRTPGEHVRGCWVVDLVLGKS